MNRDLLQRLIDAWDSSPLPKASDGMMQERMEEVRTALASPYAPTGWALVPVEPTEAMHVAAVRTIQRCAGNDDFPPRIYRAMLAAAPKA